MSSLSTSTCFSHFNCCCKTKRSTSEPKLNNFTYSVRAVYALLVCLLHCKALKLECTELYCFSQINGEAV